LPGITQEGLDFNGRCRFNVWEGLDLLDKNNPCNQLINRLKFLPELLQHQLNYHVPALDSSNPQRTKSSIKEKKQGEMKSCGCGHTAHLHTRRVTRAGKRGTGKTHCIISRAGGRVLWRGACQGHAVTGISIQDQSSGPPHFTSPHHHCLITGILQKPGRSRMVGIYGTVME